MLYLSSKINLLHTKTELMTYATIHFPHHEWKQYIFVIVPWRFLDTVTVINKRKFFFFKTNNMDAVPLIFNWEFMFCEIILVGCIYKYFYFKNSNLLEKWATNRTLSGPTRKFPELWVSWFYAAWQCGEKWRWIFVTFWDFFL